MPAKTLKWLNASTGGGFIEHATGRDIGAHCFTILASGFQRLKEGDQVRYELIEAPTGPSTANVEVL